MQLLFVPPCAQIVLEQLKIDKCCEQKFDFPSGVCQNLTEDSFEEENDLVQDEVAQFNVYVTAVKSVFPALLAFYMGAWCDLFGRKGG